MTKYHINAKGVPAICRAKQGRCPFGGDGDHYDTPEEAQEAADQAFKDEFGYIPERKTSLGSKIKSFLNMNPYANEERPDSSYHDDRVNLEKLSDEEYSDLVYEIEQDFGPRPEIHRESVKTPNDEILAIRKSLQEKEKAMQEKEQALDRKEELLAEIEQIVEQRETHIMSKIAAATERNNNLKKENQMLEEKLQALQYNNKQSSIHLNEESPITQNEELSSLSSTENAENSIQEPLEQTTNLSQRDALKEEVRQEILREQEEKERQEQEEKARIEKLREKIYEEELEKARVEVRKEMKEDERLAEIKRQRDEQFEHDLDCEMRSLGGG